MSDGAAALAALPGPTGPLPAGWPAMSIAQAHALLTAPGSMFEMEEQTVHGNRIRTWKNAPVHLGIVFQLGQMFAGKDYLVHEGERVTYDAHRRATLKLAARLIADGVKPGDRVAIVMRNIPEWPVAFWATIIVGAIATPLNAWWTGQELEYGLSDSGAKIAICDAERWERIREPAGRLESLKAVYVARDADDSIDPRVVRLESMIGPVESWAAIDPPAPPAVELDPDMDATIFYTSGTTGKPKGAVITHRNIISNIFNALCAQARAFLRRGEAPPAPDPTAPQKVFLISVPFFHATGCFAILVSAHIGGTRIVMQRRWDADQALEIIQRERVTHFGGVPTIPWQIIEHPRVGEFDLSSVESVAYGGAPSAPELVRRITERFPKAQAGQGWGMTETSATAISNGSEDYINRPWSTGVPAPTGEIRIVGPAGEDLPAGEVGELWYRGPVVVRGYWNKPQATAETFTGGWVKTGDLALVDAEGFVGIRDRAKDMLIRGGENIYCVEVENALYDHPAVMDAAVVGIAHKTLGEEPGAVVCLKPGTSATEAELRSHVAARIAGFKVPVRVILQTEPLVRNANGKILKAELRKLFPENAGT
jgi:long-chain acyl-CoA synthetase